MFLSTLCAKKTWHVFDGKLNCWFFQCYYSRILSAKLSLLFYLPIIRLTVYKRIMTRLFCKWWWWIIRCTHERGMPVSCKIPQADWLVLLTEHEVLHCCVPNAVSVTHLVDCLQQTIDVSKFPTLVCNSAYSLSSLCASYPFDRSRFLIRIASSCEIFMIVLFLLIFRSQQFPKVK